jgi:hypothetical protein
MTCPNSNIDTVCSGNGKCVYYDFSLNVLPYNCTIENVKCTAKCVCKKGFFGTDCSLNYNQAQLRSSARETMCSYIVAISNQTSKTSLLLDSMTNALYGSYKPSEFVSNNSMEACNGAVKYIIEIAADGYLKNAVEGTAATLTKVVSTFTMNFATNPNDNIVYSSLIDNLNMAVEKSMVNGQLPVVLTSDNIRINVTKYLTSTLNNFNFYAPQTQQEIAYGALQNAIKFEGDYA